MIFLSLLGLVSFVFGESTQAPPPQQEDQTELSLHRTLHALEQGLHFMHENYQNLNLDGVIGTRLVEGK